jgi:hypothetical protein
MMEELGDEQLHGRSVGNLEQSLVKLSAFEHQQDHDEPAKKVEGKETGVFGRVG